MTTSTKITPRQIEIIRALECHFSLKEIALNLSISEATLNREIRQLKVVLQAQSHRDILINYKKIAGLSDDSFSIDRITALQTGRRAEAEGASNEAGLLHFADAGSFADPSWANVFEPHVVPRWLDGDNFVFARLGAIVLQLILMLALPVLGVAMLDTLAEILRTKP